MDNLRIPTALALLGLSFTGCGKDEDTIVGTWDLTMADGEKFPLTYTEEGVSGTYSIDMKIEADLSGTLGSHFVVDAGGPDQDEGYSYPLTVDDADAPTFVINIPEAELALRCELSGSTLDCVETNEDEVWTFKRR